VNLEKATESDPSGRLVRTVYLSRDRLEVKLFLDHLSLLFEHGFIQFMSESTNSDRVILLLNVTGFEIFRLCIPPLTTPESLAKRASLTLYNPGLLQHERCRAEVLGIDEDNVKVRPPQSTSTVTQARVLEWEGRKRSITFMPCDVIESEDCV
jgi:hypothetical protein